MTVTTTFFETDTYDPNAQASEFDLIEGLIQSIPEIAEIHRRASEERWFDTATGRARYKAAIQQTNWYQENNQYARAAITAYQLARQGQGADWQTLLENARIQIEARAAELGAPLTPELLKQLESKFVYEGWGESGRQALLDKALSEVVAPQAGPSGAMSYQGMAGNVVDDLRRVATLNGISFNDDYYNSAAVSVTSGLKTLEDFQRDIREQAATMWPVFADKIRSGFDARALASPYINVMAEEFEINPNDINLGDPYIRSALGGFAPDGSPQAMNLWDFTKKIRQDPRWLNTAKAQNEITSMTGRVMQMFGLMGG